MADVKICDVCKAQGKYVILHQPRWWRFKGFGRIDVCPAHNQAVSIRRSWSWWDFQNWFKIGAPESQLTPPEVTIKWTSTPIDPPSRM